MMKRKETDKDLLLEKGLLKKVDPTRIVYHGIVLAQWIPDLISAWQLSQALSMDAHFTKHEQNALGIIVKVDLRLVNPTGETFKVHQVYYFMNKNIPLNETFISQFISNYIIHLHEQEVVR